jgi:DNA repair exonuclease SbcCD ATPase subunit/DNA repair exonuclease SbcCD nuclease subunit
MKKIKIAHLADVHVRPHQYLDEMQFTFDKFFESITAENVDLVVICGDFFHSKLTVSSEYFDVAYSFFRKLGDNFRSIIIPGNHDSALTNQGKMDSISPIVSAVNRDAKYTIQYHKKSGTFSVENCDFINFHHFSILENKTEWPKSSSLDQNKINIALYHGAINNCIVDNGWTSRGNRDDITIFSGFDFGFLGDIHKAQYLDKEETIAYPGSLRQNNFGEDINKGYLVWEIEESGGFSSRRVILDQKRYFFTFTIDSVQELGKLISENDNLPSGCRWRIKSTKNLDITDEILIKEEIIKKYSPTGDIQFMPPEDEPLSNASIKVGNLDILHDNIRDSEVQKQLIEEYFNKKELDQALIDEIVALDKVYHSHVDTDVLRDVIYNPKTLKWDNFLSYGKGNSINFDKLNGLVGVFGANGTGKSSIFDVLFFPLFNSIYREGANKNGDYVNRKCKRSSVSLEVELNQSRFVVEREIKKTWTDGKPEPKVENLVDFCKLPKSDANSLNGETGPDTNKFIRDIFGSKEDAEMLSHCSQFGLMSFVDAKGTKRKEVLSKFFDLGVFDTKFELASKDYKEIKMKLKDCNRDTLLASKAKYEEIVSKSSDDKKVFEEDIVYAKKELAELDDCILSLTKDLVKIPSFGNSDHQKDIEKLQSTVDSLTAKVDSLREFSLRHEELEELKELERIIYGYKQSLPILEKQSKLIDGVPNVPECRTCPLVGNSYAALEQVRTLSKRTSESEEVLSRLAKAKEFDRLSLELDKQKAFLQIKQASFDAYLQNVSKIKKNEEIEVLLGDLQERKSKVKKRQEFSESKFIALVAEEAGAKMKLEFASEKLLMEEGLSAKEKIYSLYLDAMSKNGISYWIISKKLTLINKLVNQILSQAVSFKFSIEENEEEKSLKVFIIDTDKGKRPIELASGGEKTLIALSFRAALWKVCLLPKMPILILDESLVFLDAERYDSAIKLIKYLLTDYFDKIFIVTHNEEIKRVVDDSIYISRHKDFSYVEVK